MDLYSYPALNIANCVTLKLNQKNYISWKSQFESFLSGQDLLGFVNGASPASLATLQVPQVGGQALAVPNPDYNEWFRADQIVRAWLLGSLSEKILAEVTGTTTAKDLWVALAKHFNKVSSSRLFELQSKLQTAEKLDRPMDEYLRDIKSICEQLASIGSPVPEKMKIFAVLKGLGREYEPIKVNIEGMIDMYPGPTLELLDSKVSLIDLLAIMLVWKSHLTWLSILTTLVEEKGISMANLVVEIRERVGTTRQKAGAFLSKSPQAPQARQVPTTAQIIEFCVRSVGSQDTQL